jgi:16S rRNA processing protein RimM
MDYQCEILIGRITKVSGFEGAVTVKIDKRFSGDLPDNEPVFLEIEGRPVPFFISESEYSGADILKVKFKYYESTEKVKEFVGCRIFSTSCKPEPHKDDDIADLAGYGVYTGENTLLGNISEIIENPGQWLIVVITPEGKEILIPFHSDFIISISRKKKTLRMRIPEGLTQIN